MNTLIREDQNDSSQPLLTSKNSYGSISKRGSVDSNSSRSKGSVNELVLDLEAKDPYEPTSITNEANLGIWSCVMLILNKMIGTGVFSTPSLIYASTGSIGISLLLWIVGGIVAFSGLSVYLEFGLEIPKSGGEKNYLERVYKKPELLAASVFAFQMVILGFSTGNSFAFGKYILYAFGYDNDWSARFIGIGVITFSTILHSIFPKSGRFLFNILGIFKIVVLFFIVFCGFAVIFGFFPNLEKTNNFNGNFFKNDGFGGGSYNIATSLLQVVYSYKGWENANYVLNEVKNPKRTLSFGGSMAILLVLFLYIFCNIAYFIVIPKDEISSSGVIIAGTFFTKIFGDSIASFVLPILICFSNLGNVLVVSYAHARVNQEFAKQNLLPFSKFFASNKPFNTPIASLFLHWLVTVLVLVLPPPGEVYEFVVNLYTYPGAWINSFVAAGLLYLQYYKEAENWGMEQYKGKGYHSPFILTVTFLFINLFLALVPFIPPPKTEIPKSYPYYAFPVTGVLVLLLGVVYWAIFIKPHLKNKNIINDAEEDVIQIANHSSL